MPDDFSYLRKLALAATKGRWIAVNAWVKNECDDLPDIVCNDINEQRGPFDSGGQMCADA